MLKIYKKNVSSILKVGQEKKYISPFFTIQKLPRWGFWLALSQRMRWWAGDRSWQLGEALVHLLYIYYMFAWFASLLYQNKQDDSYNDNTRLWAKQHCDHRETQIFVCLLCSFVCFVCLFVCLFVCFFLFVMFASPGFLLPHSSRQARTLLACFAPL